MPTDLITCVYLFLQEFGADSFSALSPNFGGFSLQHTFKISIICFIKHF